MYRFPFFMFKGREEYMVLLEFAVVSACVWLLYRQKLLFRLNTLVNGLFCLYLIQMVEGIIVSNQKYVVVTHNAWTFLTYLIHLMGTVPCTALLAVYYARRGKDGAGHPAASSIGVWLAGTIVLTLGEFMLESAGIIRYSRGFHPGASWLFWAVWLAAVFVWDRLIYLKEAKDVGAC